MLVQFDILWLYPEIKCWVCVEFKKEVSADLVGGV